MCEIYKNLSLENIDDEIWKEINGYNGDYFIGISQAVISNIKNNKSWKIYE